MTRDAIDRMRDHKSALTGVDRSWFERYDRVLAPRIRAGGHELCPPHLTREEAVKTFWKAWIGVSIIDHLDERHVWLAYLRRIGGWVGANGVLRPHAPVVLFRGSARESRHGLSWTPSRYVARAFAEGRVAPRTLNRNPALGEVWRAVVPPLAILGGHLEGEGYVEYVVDTDGLAVTRDHSLGTRRA